MPSLTKQAIHAILLTLVGALSCHSIEGSAPRTTDGGTPPDVTPDADSVSPEVIFLVPAHEETNVSTRRPIRIVFSEAMRFGTTPATLFANDVAIPAKFVPSSDATMMSIEPLVELPIPAQVSVALNDISDLHGNPLVRPPWSWRVPRWLPIGNTIRHPEIETLAVAPSSRAKNTTSLLGGSFKCPAMVAGPGEEVSLVSSTSVEGREGQQLNLRRIGSPAGVWSESLVIGQAQTAPSLVMDKDGQLVAAFLGTDDRVVINRLGGVYVDEPFRSVQGGRSALAMDADGVVFLAYDAAATEGGSSIEVAALPRGNSYWTSLGTVNPLSEQGAHVRSLMLDKNRTPYVAYVDSSNDARVRVWSKGQWSLVGAPLNGQGEQVIDLVIAADADTNVFALVNFGDRALPRSRVQLLRFDGANWVNSGPEIANITLDDPMIFAPMRNGHLFAYLSIPPALETLEITRDGWTRIPPPAVVSPAEDRLTAGSGAVDSNGVPVVGWSDAQGLHVARLNR